MDPIAAEIRATKREETALQKRMHKLGMVLGIAGVASAAAVFGLEMLRGYEIIEMMSPIHLPGLRSTLARTIGPDANICFN